jgi:hypothetical protein
VIFIRIQRPAANCSDGKDLNSAHELWISVAEERNKEIKTARVEFTFIEMKQLQNNFDQHAKWTKEVSLLRLRT